MQKLVSMHPNKKIDKYEQQLLLKNYHKRIVQAKSTIDRTNSEFGRRLDERRRRESRKIVQQSMPQNKQDLGQVTSEKLIRDKKAPQTAPTNVFQGLQMKSQSRFSNVMNRCTPSIINIQANRQSPFQQKPKLQPSIELEITRAQQRIKELEEQLNIKNNNETKTVREKK